MENISLACSEVYCLLEILGDSYKNKLPIRFLEFINQNRKEEFSLEINENEDEYTNLKISKDGLVLISFLNLKYWVEDETEKQRLIEIYKKNDEKSEENINRYKDPDWLKKSNQKDYSIENIATENIENTNENRKNEKIDTQNAMIELKKFSIIEKIKSVIKKIFNK